MRKIPGDKIFGVALDIGTTDIKGSLLDISSKRELARASVPNEQKAFGQDVITRLHFATKTGGLKELNKRVISAVNKLLRRLAKDASVDLRDIKNITAVGNSTMYHLILMIRPEKLARAPFTPSEKKLQRKNARKMGISAGRDTVFKFLPNISGFIGSDILAAILTTGLHKDKEYNLIVDMGTNGEIALGSKNRIFVASCASGPAFEGRHIRCGMPAGNGAVVRAKRVKNRLTFQTIGGGAPEGITGSGLIDIVSYLLDKRGIDRKGRMKEKEFTLYKKGARKIFITQNDIRQLQLAKAALSSGVEILRKRAKIDLKKLKGFYITGTFGTGINKKNAKNIGLIPREIALEKVRFLKDGALSGVKKVLLESAGEKEIKGILAKCRHIELQKDRDFMDIFAGAIYF